MRGKISILCGLAIAIFLATLGTEEGDAFQSAAEIIYHVAPDGDGGNPGTQQKPLASLQQARDKIRAQKKQNGGKSKQPVRVIVHEGTYVLSEPLVFTSEDSGSKDSPISYQAASGAKPVFSGGKVLAGWKETTLQGKKLWSLSIPEVKAGKWDFQQMWIKDQRRPRARHPNKGFLKIAGLPDVAKNTPYNVGQQRFKFKAGDIKNWNNLQDVDVVVLHLWVAVRLAIEKVDEEGQIVNFKSKSKRRLTDGEDPARYYVENALELLDEPGEWYLDRPTGMLYYWPMPGEKMTGVRGVAPVLPHLVRFDGKPEAKQNIEYVTLEGLTFAHAGWWPERADTTDVQAAAGVPAVIEGNGLNHCLLKNCTVAHASGYGIHLARGCQHNEITDCQLFDLGAGGIRIGETTSRANEREQTHDNLVHKNHLHHLGRAFPQAVGLWIGQSYKNKLAHNHVHDLFYTGISCGWTWGYGKTLAKDNLIENNHVHDIGQGLLSDMAGIYTLGTQPGTIIRHNKFHDIAAFRYGGWGIYFDEGSTNIVAEKNLVWNTTHGGFHQHYGKENIVRNNIFAFGRDAQIRRSREEPHKSFTFENNIVYWKEGKLLDGTWNNFNFAFDKNLYWKVGDEKFTLGKWTWEQWRNKGMDKNSVIADPLFSDPAKFDFRLKADSPALKIGFMEFLASKSH